MSVLGSAQRSQRARAATLFVEAAERLAEEGTAYAAVSVAEIARRAGFSRASFYAHFPDKLALAVAVGERLRAGLEGEVGGWLRGEDELTLAQALARVAATFRRHRGAVLLITEAAAYDPEIRALRRGLVAGFERPLVARVAAADPGLPPAQAESRAFVLVWATQSALAEWLVDGDRDADADDLVAGLAAVWAGVLGGSAA